MFFKSILLQRSKSGGGSTLTQQLIDLLLESLTKNKSDDQNSNIRNPRRRRSSRKSKSLSDFNEFRKKIEADLRKILRKKKRKN